MSQIPGRLQRPIITGKPTTAPAAKQRAQQGTNTPSFQELLQQTLQKTQTLTLSKHAQARTEQRGISLAPEQMERLDQAVTLAEDKGLTDTLVLMEGNAFIVNVPNRVVVTVVGGEQREGAVFTNIDGAVIV